MFRSHHTLALFALALSATLAAPSAQAFKLKIPTSIKLPGAVDPRKADKELQDINRELIYAIKSVPSSFGSNPEQELNGIERQQKVFDKLRARVKPTMKIAGENYGIVTENLDVLQRNLVRARAAQECSAARMVILKKHKRNAIGAKSEFVRFFKANKAFKAVARDWDNIVKFFDDELTRMKAEIPTLREKQEKNKAAALDKEAKKALSDAGRKANTAIKSLGSAVKRRDEITDEQLSELATAAGEIEAINANSGAHYRIELEHYTRHQLWAQPDGKAQKAIAKSIDGKLVAKGITKGKAMKVKVKAKKGRCYVMFSDFKKTVGTEKVEEFTWESKKAQVQRFVNTWGKGKGVLPIQGFCAVKNGTVTAKADLTFSGTRNGVRYAVVEVKKAEFPMVVASHMSLKTDDRCDFGYWRSLWLDPVPGTFAYNGGEPVLITYADDIGGNRNASTLTLNGKWGTTRKTNLSSKAPRNIAVAAQFGKWGCPDDKDRAFDKASKKIIKCYAKIAKKYDKEWDKVDRLRASAGRRGMVNVGAEEYAEQLREKGDRDRNKRCQPLKDKVTKQAEKEYNKLVDKLTDDARSDSLQRAEQLMREEEAPLRRW